MKALLKVLSLSLLIAYPCLGLPDQRAQPWKPQRLVGSAQLSIFQIDAIVLPESASKSLVDSVTDFSNLIQRVSGRSVPVLSEGRPKNAIYFQLTADLSKGGGFTIHRERTRVFIRSGDPAGWSNALYTIGQEMLGARYYWAGDLGLEYVKPSITHFPNRPWRETLPNPLYAPTEARENKPLLVPGRMQRVMVWCAAGEDSLDHAAVNHGSHMHVDVKHG